MADLLSSPFTNLSSLGVSSGLEHAKNTCVLVFLGDFKPNDRFIRVDQIFINFVKIHMNLFAWRIDLPAS